MSEVYGSYRGNVALGTILEELREVATSPRDLGDRFEHLMANYLRQDPLYATRFSQAWLWHDWPLRGNEPDTGIDIVAQERATGEYCAIQCKCYHPDRVLDKGDIDSFFTASGRRPFTSRLIIATTDRWSKHAEQALRDQVIPVTRLGVADLAQSAVDWGQCSVANLNTLPLKARKQLRPHQQKAVQAVMTGFQTSDRGKLIMACGTGKTFTSLKIAEQMVVPGETARILFLVPSISLLAQTLREWIAEAAVPVHAIAVCSDTQVGQRRRRDDPEDIAVQDLPFPATTQPEAVAQQVAALLDEEALTVVFSTYQSIGAVAEAQSQYRLDPFDLVICDEAHRTTGATLQDQEESAFVRVHDAAYLQAKMRLYMTATPRLYGDIAKTKAKENDIVLCSMDDEPLYGPEFHRLDFGEAVEAGLLTDYRVMVLAVDEQYASQAFQRQLADGNNELDLDDAVKILGCWKGLSQRRLETGRETMEQRAPLRRAVAFSRSIKDSKRIVSLFAQLLDDICRLEPEDPNFLPCELDHVDGTHKALERQRKLDWLKADTRDQGNLCRILSNARCLSEGIDVPALDAVMFLTPRNSVVDVVQAVGRVMRRAEGKDYGYIILPIGIPAGTPPEQALRNNERYKIVWQVLQALRAHDDRFNATINQLDLNQSWPDQIDVVGVPSLDKQEGVGDSEDTRAVQLGLTFPDLEEWRNAIYAKIVETCGDRFYWEKWAKDVATIFDRSTTRIRTLLAADDPTHQIAFDQFLTGLHHSVNPNISRDDAIDMLGQQLVTRPIFDALFADYPFARLNPVSQAMEQMLEVLDGAALYKELTSLDKFYASVRRRAEGIDNAAGKQKIILELYNSFFRHAFPHLAERLGIVYTPVEVVDFILHSVDTLLRDHFQSSLTAAGVNIVEPFAGTGTFIVRMLQQGLIHPQDLARKFAKEIHANEIVLLAYYIAAINIEATYHDLMGSNYTPFPGIVLTDTFRMFEHDNTLLETMFPENNERVLRQKQLDIEVIISNPPYSAGQTSENDGNKNEKYPQLDQRISETYAHHSTATNRNSLYDSYIRAIRWASDRVADKGIVAFVTNGSFLDNNAMDGLRQSLYAEFSHIYCFNLRGNQRTSGETSRKEGGKIFGSNSRTPVAITFLIKDPTHSGPCQLRYHDIGDYLNRDQKLHILETLTASDPLHTIPWQAIAPNASHDWINQRDTSFQRFTPLGDKNRSATRKMFALHSSGVKTNRDAWCYNFSREALIANIERMIDFYNQQVEVYALRAPEQDSDVDRIIDTDPEKISWTRELKQDLEKLKSHQFIPEEVVTGVYRPFCKQTYYFDREFNGCIYRMPRIFPIAPVENLAICVTGPGSTKQFSVLISNTLPDLELISKSQCFSLYTYTPLSDAGPLFQESQTAQYTRDDNITDATLTDYQTTYRDLSITKADIFYYVYGILHSPEYKTRFAADLKKMLPRIPHAADFWAFSTAGRNLAHWHLNYETIDPYPLEEQIPLNPTADHYRVEKMTFAKKGRKLDKTTLHYNSHITLSGIPLEAYDYQVCDRSAIEWIMDRYQVKKDRASGILNDPNTWSEDPRYILDLLKRIVRVSLESVAIVQSLPPLNELEANPAHQLKVLASLS